MTDQSSSQPIKVVIVNDDKGIIGLITLLLQRMGYDVWVSETGNEGLELVSSIIPDLVILDIMMPDLDGIEVLKRLKANPDLRDIPVIMMNPFIERYQERMMKMGAAYYLDVPFSPENLVDAVIKVLGFDSEGNVPTT